MGAVNQSQLTYQCSGTLRPGSGGFGGAASSAEGASVRASVDRLSAEGFVELSSSVAITGGSGTLQ